MDFSSKYEFPVEMKQATANRKMAERAVQALDVGKRMNYLWRGDTVDRPDTPVEYEVWCFMPPSQRLLTALDAARANGAQVTLDQAFVQAALMFRKAFSI